MSLVTPLSIRNPVRPLLTLFGLVVCMVVLLPFPAHAAQQRAIGAVVVPSGETAPEVSTAVGDVTVNGHVEDDVETGRGDVLLRGPVDGDVRSTVGNVEVREPVGGDIEIEVGDVRVNSVVEGDIDVNNGDVYLGPEARVGGDVECGSGRITGNRDAVQGGVEVGMASSIDRPDGEPGDGSAVLGIVGWLLLTLVFAACTVLLAVLATGTLSSASRSLERYPGRSLLFGVVSVPAAIVLGVVLAISVVGIPVLILLAPAYLAFVFFGALVAAYFVGRKILLATGRYRGGNALAAVVGAVAVSAVSRVPFVGDLVLYGLALAGAGATMVALMNRRRSRADHGPYEPYGSYAETRR